MGNNAQVASVWNVETLRVFITELLAALDKRMSERYTASEKAVEVAFNAQTTAMQTAFASQKEAVTIAFVSQKEAVTAALAAADRAVVKAELAAEKRFEAVNEFRNTLADQQRTLMPRSEAEAIIRGLKNELEATVKVLTEKIEAVTQSQIASQGVKAGVGAGWGYAVGVVGFLLLVLGIVAFFKVH